VAATILLFSGALALIAAAFIVLTGGVTLRTPPLTLRDPLRPLIAGVVLLAIAAIAAGRDFAAIARAFAGPRDRVAATIAALASACALVFAIAWTSRAAGGSDSSCYVLQAEAFAHGHAALENPVARVLPDVPNAVFAPIGFLPSPRAYGSAVPICAPGLALAMAGAYLVHPSAVFLVVPLAAALLVWLTFVYGRRVSDDVIGACGAVLVACSPIFLYQAVQPMSDVPASAAWLASLVSASPVAAGVWASIAILIRPNLALLVVPILFLEKGTVPFSGNSTKFLSEVWKRGLSPFLMAGLPGVGLLLALNAVRYGGVFTSGYGHADSLFSLAHVGPNLARYPAWIAGTETPFLLLAVAAPWVLRREPGRARLAWVSLAAVALLVTTYLLYTVFDDWWYIRFLLPALPILIVLSLTVVRRAIERLPRAARRMTLLAVTAALALSYLHVARDRRVIDLQRLESRFALAGEYAGRHVPADAVILAGQQSGSLRFHGGRATIAWDSIPPADLDAVIAALHSAGRPVLIAVEDGEDQRFRERFAGQRWGGLDWAPRAILPPPTRVHFFDVPAR